MSEAAQATGLVKVFGGTRAVDGLDLSIPHGSFYGIAGPNGAGKSTAIRMLVGLLQPDAGSASVDGMDVWPDPLQAKAVLGYVPDNPVLFDRLSAQEMLEYAGLLRGMDREVIRHARRS